MKIFNGKNAVLGRLASLAAKESLKGEEIIILNCENILISGSKTNIKSKFLELRQKGGHSQKGPIHSIKIEKIVKRTIRGMLPNHRFGRGRQAFKRIKCYKGIPEEFKNKDMINFEKKKLPKYIKLESIGK
ncbi:MAG: 50S ribosomal protein L13 [Nanoarchaeota archaeon]